MLLALCAWIESHNCEFQGVCVFHFYSERAAYARLIYAVPGLYYASFQAFSNGGRVKCFQLLQLSTQRSSAT